MLELIHVFCSFTSQLVSYTTEKIIPFASVLFTYGAGSVLISIEPSYAVVAVVLDGRPRLVSKEHVFTPYCGIRRARATIEQQVTVVQADTVVR